MNKIINFFVFSETILAMVRFLRLSFAMLFMAHWIACLWFAIGDNDNDNNWVEVAGIKTQPCDE